MYEENTGIEVAVAPSPVSRPAKPQASQEPLPSADKTGQKTLKRLDPARRSAVEKMLEEMPQTARGNYIRAVNGRGSPRNAIKAHCLECMGWPHPEVARCTSLSCSFYAYRPSFKDKKGRSAGLKE